MHQSQFLSIPVNSFSHWQSSWACGTPAFDSPASASEPYLPWRNPVWLSRSHVNTQMCKDIWVQKLLQFSKAHTSYSKSFIKPTARLNSLAACNTDAAISPFSSVWACSVHRLLYGERSRLVSSWRERREKYDEQKKFAEKKMIYLYI